MEQSHIITSRTNSEVLIGVNGGASCLFPLIINGCVCDLALDLGVGHKEIYKSYSVNVRFVLKADIMGVNPYFATINFFVSESDKIKLQYDIRVNSLARFVPLSDLQAKSLWTISLSKYIYVKADIHRSI